MTENEDTAPVTEPTQSDTENITQFGLAKMFDDAEQPDSPEPEVSTTEEASEPEEEEPVLSQFEEEEPEEVSEESDTEDSEPKGLQKLLKQNKRLTARAKGAEEELEKLRSQQLADSSTGPAPLENIHDLEELEKFRKTATSARKFAMKNIGKDYVEHNGEEFDAEKIASLLEEADEALTVTIPQREKHIHLKAQTVGNMPAHFDWLDDDKSPITEYYQIARGLPELQLLHTMPQGEFMFGLLAEGWQVIQGKAKALQKHPKTDSTQAKPEPPTPVSTNSAPPKTTKKDRNSILGDGNVDLKTFTKFLDSKEES